MVKQGSKENFDVRMAILAFMINKEKPVSASEVKVAVNLKDFKMVNYYLGSLADLGVIIPLGKRGRKSEYVVQPFMLSRAVDPLLKNVFDQAFSDMAGKFIVVKEKTVMKARIEAFSNAFTFYIRYLLQTGDFKLNGDSMKKGSR